MANTSSAQNEKQPGRFRQVIDVFKMTAKYDKPGVALMIAAFIVPVVLAIVLCLIFYANNVIMWIMFVLLGVLFGVLLFMFALNWRAERVAYSQLEGQKGATGAVLTSSLRGQWKTSDMPVAFNPRTQDVLFRAVGKPGVVLFTESANAHSKKLLADERRKIQRLLPTVPVHHLQVGGEGGIKLGQLKGAVGKLPNKLTKAEILAVDSRLASLQGNQMPIPKGIDPNKVRPSRSQMR
ncbi:DUF4191 family protein [Gulosibacter macacae]|uniref:DUF4191 family protein n=1 Tax=Gulosibacter macacae TaxID=2488791 RepID=A0A3P3W1F9_9MICO|nr:DUF4191 domain-containing protein [Gulosibacter macacae]RRJ88810.1 DUF4191 family protein [Gulosibacter macacae]